ncbi:hypothetical protein FLK61_24225 [Paenalkalicoccus suaedae]|uniref:Uncharacterized protein n=1 Tax=Paenalkalicoccus suaedae TaxID=2592382 RepID=A0A859F9P2_9BACI|nr:hypothetical protein [Paenalkalicoccus suaedae]QKS69893.1 hypothetical protein FLK61_24225 [Paenalkalicoccus suaedae]
MTKDKDPKLNQRLQTYRVYPPEFPIKRPNRLMRIAIWLGQPASNPFERLLSTPKATQLTYLGVLGGGIGLALVQLLVVKV